MPRNLRNIKVDSDRPDLDFTIRNTENEPVDLSGASVVEVHAWNPDGTKAFQDTASVIDPPLGRVRHDIDNAQVQTPGRYDVEIRVLWDDGDQQWFPIEERSFKLRVVAPPTNRAAAKVLGNPILRVGATDTHTVGDGLVQTYQRTEVGGTVRNGGTIQTGGY